MEKPARPAAGPTLCPDATELEKAARPQAKFSVYGYEARTVTVLHDDGGEPHEQCVVVWWPKAPENNAGETSHVFERIDDAWLRAIENTLLRVPFSDAATVHRIVIDNRPTRHGIAAFDRHDPEDGRDGHTIWLHEHLFVDPNHWERGIRGDYFAYHSNVDGEAFDDLPSDHDRFSPVLLHEIGHLVMYHFINPEGQTLEAPPCARTCSDDGTCVDIPPEARELPCITPYCRPFKYLVSTENWAEQYRFYYQSSVTRTLLATARRQHPNCLDVLSRHDDAVGDPHDAPWARGLPDIAGFHRSRWDSCGGRACKPW